MEVMISKGVIRLSLLLFSLLLLWEYMEGLLGFDFSNNFIIVLSKIEVFSAMDRQYWWIRSYLSLIVIIIVIIVIIQVVLN
jgi:hypothetical protein